ncbi:hypothetical protein [Neotamlana laminarinivorans]|uniref:Uncharacterized protein n=1 Tax=Neotamlana laminarinivorans TaxID=2883124 RepID=A0A9X1HYC8_9FLAO|nr:hypothetical protein [Tamlana laminarinivorans]MCB4797223.1 hypothetical protein [Tamlana laminarinivorans]
MKLSDKFSYSLIGLMALIIGYYKMNTAFDKPGYEDSRNFLLNSFYKGVVEGKDYDKKIIITQQYI